MDKVTNQQRPTMSRDTDGQRTFVAFSDKYTELAADSLKAGSVEHGLQYNAIYWETGHKTYTSFLSPFTQKFSWEVIDNQLRRLFGFHRSASMEPFVFYGPFQYFRAYYGDPAIHEVASLKKRSNFSFYPTGCYNPFAAEKRSSRMPATDAVNEIFRSAFSVDYHYALSTVVPTAGVR